MRGYERRQLLISELTDAIETFVSAKVDYERAYREHGGDMGSAIADELSRARARLGDKLAEVIP